MFQDACNDIFMDVRIMSLSAQNELVCACLCFHAHICSGNSQSTSDTQSYGRGAVCVCMHICVRASVCMYRYLCTCMHACLRLLDVPTCHVSTCT
jgi:hypothetical protein